MRRVERRVYSITGNDEKVCFTALVIANAAGDLPPSMVVLAHERVPSHVVSKFSDGWSIGKSDSG